MASSGFECNHMIFYPVSILCRDQLARDFEKEVGKRIGRSRKYFQFVYNMT